MQLLILLVVGVALATAQAPPRCASPPQWEGRLFRIDPSQKWDLKARFSYDAINERVRRIEEIDIGSGRKEFFDIIEAHSVGKRYIFNLIRKNCTVEELTEPFQKFEIPDNSSFLGEAVIGSMAVPEAGLQVSIWSSQRADDRVFGTWTMVGCLPVNYNFISPRSGLIHNSFFDLSLGISDPNVFVPSHACQ